MVRDVLFPKLMGNDKWHFCEGYGEAIPPESGLACRLSPISRQDGGFLAMVAQYDRSVHVVTLRRQCISQSQVTTKFRSTIKT